MSIKPSIRLALLVLAGLLLRAPAIALDRPFISDTFFYWYTWDYDREMGGWIGGVYNTPLEGYYDSRTFRDNYRSLRTASEWGITHHFMDYWAPTWKADTGEMREAVVMRAAEQLRREGYNTWMSYYQDGENFAMRDFARNVTEKRDVHQWLRDFARSPVWPRVGGRPLQLVYGRNGAPEITPDDAGFRVFLQGYYKDLAALNREWGTKYASFDDIRHSLSTTGWQRALAVRYQFALWEKDWRRMQDAVRKEFGLPGIAASFDVAYRPYAGLSYSRYTRLFDGPHSYGGIFGLPHDQDAERFIQSLLAKRYQTVFFDHFKNFYHDWEIRIPGTAYLPEYHAFDRFWVGDLMRYNEAILHLSWNEWWEGSNLEPSREFGKTHCEKNLFYSTIMQECFPALRDYGKNARVALLLNDWLVEAGAESAGEVLAAVQALRRSMIPFDLLPDEFVTDKELSRFTLVVAPAGRLGVGRNGREERIEEVLRRWVRGAAGRRLLLSGAPALARSLDLKPAVAAPAAAGKPGPDLNVFVDVGSPGDDRFLRGGASPEDWSRLGAGQFGAAREPLTVRWTPGTGEQIRFALPGSPGRDHLLRFRGRPFRENRVQVLVGDQLAGEVKIAGDFRVYEVPVPARLLPGRGPVRVTLAYLDPVIPRAVDPEHFPGESRACNLALDWVQWSTANVGLSREQQYVMPKERIALVSPAVEIALRQPEYEPLRAPEGSRVLSRYVEAGLPRDIAFRAGQGQVLYVNGQFSDTDSPVWWDALLGGWAGQRPATKVTGTGVIGSRLPAGDTELVLAYNYGAKPAGIQCGSMGASDAPILPIASVRALARDGRQWERVPFTTEKGRVRFTDRVGYYAVYEVARSAVRVAWPEAVFQLGEARSLPVRVQNLTRRPVQGRLSLESYVPTLKAQSVRFSLPAGGSAVVALPVRVDARAEWGRRTVVLRVDAAGRRCSLWQPLTLQRNPDLSLAARLVSPGRALLTVRNTASPYIGTAPAESVRLRVAGRTLAFPNLPAGAQGSVEVDTAGWAAGRTPDAKSGPDAARAAASAAGEHSGVGHRASVSMPAPADLSGVLTCTSRGLRRVTKVTLRLPQMPPAFPRLAGAEGVYWIYNPSDRPVDGQTVDLGPAPRAPCHVREAGGHVVPSQASGGRLHVLVSLRPRSTLTLTRCAGPGPATPSDLSVQSDALGTGRGRVTLRGARLALTFDEARGGAMTSLVSSATGRDYGLDSFGATEGVFGTPDPMKPAQTSTQFIKDRRTGIADAARIEVEARGPLFAAVRVTARLGTRTVRTRYVLPARSGEFQVERTLSPAAARAGEEVVVLDVPLRRNAITKIFPNFTGMVESKPQPHFGWREGGFVPPYASLMSPADYRESVSFVLRSSAGVARFRQGIWPARRTAPGPAEVARLEYLAAPGVASASLRLTVMVHPGHQWVARRRLEEPEPYAVVVERPRWSGQCAAAAAPADWQLPYHHRRAPVRVVGSPAPDQWIGATMPEGAPADADYRLVALAGGDARELPVRADPARRTFAWQAVGASGTAPPTPPRSGGLGGASGTAPPTPPPPPPPPRGGGLGGAEPRYLLYFDARAAGPDCLPSAPAIAVGPEVSDPSFEDGSTAWQFAGASRAEGDAAAGKFAARLACAAQGAPSLAGNASMALRPNSLYRLTFRAKAVGKPAMVRTNLYADAAYDFPQVAIAVDPGEWRTYAAALSTGDFPLGIHPVLRLWILDAGQSALVDDVHLKWAGERSDKAAGVRVELGPVEASGGF